jgi:hypothetical protein
MDPHSWSFSGINWLAILLAVVANFIIGFVYYAKWFPTGKAWMKHMGMDPNMKPDSGAMMMGMILMLVGAFLTMFVLSHDFWAYKDAYTNAAAGGDATYKLSLMDGLMGGFFVWLGFFLPPILGSIAWEKRKPGLAAINAGYHLVSMLVAGVIIAMMSP